MKTIALLIFVVACIIGMTTMDGSYMKQQEAEHSFGFEKKTSPCKGDGWKCE